MHSITTAQLAEASPANIIDVREPDEFAAGHVPGARNIPLATVPDHVDELRELSDEDRLTGDHFDEARHEQVVEDLRELRDEMRLHEDPTTSREAFEQEVAELGLSDEARDVGDPT